MKRSSIALVAGLLGTLAFGCSSATDGGVAAAASAEETATDIRPAGELGLTPAYWNVDALDTSPTPGSEPINLIIDTDVPMEVLVEQLQWTRTSNRSSLLRWHQVEMGTDLLGKKQCISEERGLIDGAPSTKGTAPQAISARLGTPTEGCTGIVVSGESHARGWRSDTRTVSPNPEKRVKANVETWYFALSQEAVCDVLEKEKSAAAKLSRDGTRPWHCIAPNDKNGLGGGYNVGRDDFVRDLQGLGDPSSNTGVRMGAKMWDIDCKYVLRDGDPKVNGGGGGEGLYATVPEGYANSHKENVQLDPRSADQHHQGSKWIMNRVKWDDKAMYCKIRDKAFLLDRNR